MSQHDERRRLAGEILRMGAMADAQLEAALEAVARGDAAAARRVVEADSEIDRLEQETSHDVMRLATQGLMAGDLRGILAALRIAADIERIGDYAANIAKRSLALKQLPHLPPTRGLAPLGTLALQQVRAAMAAYQARDAASAERVRQADAALDAQYTSLFRELLTWMMEDPRQITGCTHLLFMAKNLERIGDHATNIAEYVLFQVTGEESLPPREKRDATAGP